MNKKRYILLFVTIVLACLLRLYINNTTLIVDTSVKAPNGYLEIDDYVLLDYQTSENHLSRVNLTMIGTEIIMKIPLI